MAKFNLQIRKKPIQHRIVFIKSKDDIIKDILEAPGYRITNKCIVVSYLGNKPYCLRPYKSKHGSNVVDLRINGKYKSFHIKTLYNKYFPKNIPSGFKEIKGFEGLYYINEQGEILSESCNNNSNKGRRLLKQSINKNGYNIVNLCNKTYLVHRLVAQTFIPNIYKLPQVNHKNEIKTDNRVCNLEWCDEKYNINYGTRIYRCAEKYRKPVKVINIKTGINKVCDSYSSACCYIKCTRGSIRYALLHDSIINNTYKVELL